MKSIDSDGKNLLISGGQVCTPFELIEDGVVLVKNDTIAAVGQAQDVEAPENTTVLEARGGYILPGFIDLHVNGGGGKDITAGTEEAIHGIAQGHATCGTTGLLVAVTGPSEEVAVRGLRSAASVSSSGTDGGAKVLGVHMEGPFVSPKRQGPVFREYPDVALPSVDRIKPFIEAAEGILRIVTMAPELEGATNVIEYLVSQGITASIGHTEATYEETVAGIEAGVSYASHMFNAMTGLHHRKPGTVGALLTSPEQVTLELIADGYHVHKGAIELVLLAKGINQSILVTDSTEVVGTDLTSFTLPVGGGITVQVREGRTWGPEGQLIGSVLQMNHAVRNMHQWFSHLSLCDIVSSATWRPAKTIGLADVTGSLEVGKAADLAVLARDFEVIATIVDGEVVYRS